MRPVASQMQRFLRWLGAIATGYVFVEFGLYLATRTGWAPLSEWAARYRQRPDTRHHVPT